MNITHKTLIAGIAFTAGSFALVGQDPPVKPKDTGKSDNTRINKRDRKPSEMTADQQKMNGGDRELARKIRRAVVTDKSLSTYAHNVKIIVRDGMITLKGPVKTEDEKKTIEAKAVQAAGGADKVKNEISVTP